MSATLDYVGRIEPVSRSACRVDCQECDRAIPDDDQAYVYFDVSIATYTVRCAACHLTGGS
jgi:hypothetical protein